MFQYESEKRPPSSNSCDSRGTMTTDWSRVYPTMARAGPSVASVASERARRPLPPRPIVCERIPVKHTVPLKVWIIASASCFAVCAALVLATVVITKWGASQSYSRELYESPEPVYSNSRANYPLPKTTTEENDIQLSILEKLPIFKNAIGNRDRKVNDLASKPQIHPLHDPIDHAQRKIEKKDQAKLTNFDNINNDLAEGKIEKEDQAILANIDNVNNDIPEFKPTLPDIFINKHKDIKLFDGYMTGLRKHDYEEYYNDENLYDDYMESNSMTNYLIEKVQELHNWITSDPDFEEAKNRSKTLAAANQFGQVLKALNDSLVEGNVTIIMNKLKDLYFGENYTTVNNSRRIILSNSTDLLSFGILSLDVMLLHNIQLMAWESQEAARIKMLKDPDVFAFNALFLDPTKVEKQNEVNHHDTPSFSKRQNLRQEFDEFSVGKSLLENLLEIGMGTARAAIHLGRAYKNTKNILNHISNHEPLNSNLQAQLSRNIDGNTHALSHLKASFSGAAGYTDLDCVWLLYCRNLVATARLNPPYGTMARINGMALRMLTGDLPADRALETILYEAFTGWTDLRCDQMFPKCSKADAASVVLDTVLQPVRKTQTNRVR